MQVLLIKHLTNSSRETLKFIAHCLWGGSEREGLPQLRHEFVRSAPFHLRLSVSLAPQSVLLRYIHCHVLLLTTFRDGKCLVSSYCQGQGSINWAILPSRYPWFPISSHFEGQIAHLSLPWSNGWVALSFLFVWSVVPLWWHLTKSPLLLPLDPQTHTFSESLW